MNDTETKGISLRILSGVLFTGMALCVKMASGHAPLGQIVFARSFFALLPLVLFLWLRGEWPNGLATQRPFGHLMRSALGAAGMFASFATLARLSVAEATMLAYLSPLFTALIAAAFLSERLTRGGSWVLAWAFWGWPWRRGRRSGRDRALQKRRFRAMGWVS
jgi:drug/metabolite transporter (DMT)-like permease